MSYLYQIIVNGLHNGVLYGLLAYSYVFLHQVAPKPNLAHGAFFALSAQVLVLGATLAYNGLILTFASSLAFGALVSLLLSLVAITVFSRLIIPKFRARSPNMMIVATLALAIIFMEAVHIGADGRDFWLPPLSNIGIDLGFGASLTLVQVCNIGVIVMMLWGTEGVLQWTGMGRAIRAVSQDEKAAALCGIDVEKVVVWTAATASLMACIGGMLAVLHFGNMSFGAGLSYGLKVLFIAYAGGFTRPRDAAAGAFIFGILEACWDGYMPIMWREPVFFAGLALFLCLRGRTGE